ncbi:ferritin-like metal-binding protein YciE [Flavobacterium endophyticum]|uniref:Ferritin-like metal-binding protein YciE n=1 Tax=Flavobacterium endophyticum TaxID=1540163 RepID=A0A495MGB0_9FLAO|nr:ferritin-like domain-containing protein [Flavobacterium endophyticum]RKS25004.1 ferritin-like metal-binding protein YciE [Flavobacterium endophyticum]
MKNSNSSAAKNSSKTTAKSSNSKNSPSASKSTAKSPSSSAKTVKPKANAADGLRELFMEQLKDIYWAEKALTKALPKMAKNATSENLKAAIEDHLEVTKEQVARLEEVFDTLGKKATAKKCDAMEGLIKEGEGILEETEPGAVRDAGIIAASQKIEHYEIASYGTLCAFAKTLGEDEAARLLEITLNEEKEADVTLTEAAYNTINFDAADDIDETEE